MAGADPFVIPSDDDEELQETGRRHRPAHVRDRELTEEPVWQPE